MNFFYLFILSLYVAKAPIEVSLGQQFAVNSQEQLSFSSYNQQEVTVRGFLFQREADGRWVLSSSPPVPPCCKGKEVESIQVVLAEGFASVSDAHSVTAIRGIFNVSIENDAEGRSVAHYSLQDPVELIAQKPNSQSSCWVEALAVGAVLALAGFWLLKRRS